MQKFPAGTRKSKEQVYGRDHAFITMSIVAVKIMRIKRRIHQIKIKIKIFFKCQNCKTNMARKLTSPLFYLSKYVISDGFPWVIRIFRQAKICSLIIRHLLKDFFSAKAGHHLSKYLCVKTMKSQSK